MCLSRESGPESFARLGIREPFLRALRALEFTQPTPIQEAAIPPALEGRDVVGQARTGTGKTAAFALPILERVFPGEGPQALILAPTRELAAQVSAEVERLARYDDVRSAPVYGGVSFDGQRRALARGAEIVVGTPGRILDHARRGTLDLGAFSIVVIDECDRMFDLGFRPDIERILDRTTGRRQLLLFSATVEGELLKIVARHMRDPVVVRTVPEKLTVDEVEQRFVTVARDRKVAALMRLLRDERPAQAIIFTRTKRGAERLARRLDEEGVTVEELHGDLLQERRERVLKQFRAGSVRLLVATDVAARGLDIPTVSHVINYDMPDEAEAYVHRVGRTARMGALGKAITLVEPGQGGLLTAVEKLTNVEVKESHLDGFDAGALAAPPRRQPVAVSAGTVLVSTWEGSLG
jgi:ATP-dependent RNA helicase DeaD